MSPYIDCLVVEHEKTFGKLPITIEVYSITSLDVFIVTHKLWCLFVTSDEAFLVVISCGALLRHPSFRCFLLVNFN